MWRLLLLWFLFLFWQVFLLYFLSIFVNLFYNLDICEIFKFYEIYGEVFGMFCFDIYIELIQENVFFIWGYVECFYDIIFFNKIKVKFVIVIGEKCDDCDCGFGKLCEECDKVKCECIQGKYCNVCGMDICFKYEGEGVVKVEGKKDGSEMIWYLLKERFVGDFSREFVFLGLLQEFDIGVSLEDGILKVVVLKQEVVKGGRKIEIQQMRNGR